MQTLFDAPPSEPGLLGRFRKAVSRTRAALSGQIGDLFQGGAGLPPDLVEDLEMTLVAADLGIRSTQEIIEDVRKGLARQELPDAAAIERLIANRILEILKQAETETPEVRSLPEVILTVGVNGVGKTTTIGKLAHRMRGEGRTVMLAAGDTFRAAAGEQLAIWGDRTRSPVVRQRAGADPSAVVYDALEAAKSRSMDAVIIDTAGRLHNKDGLMAELAKIHRTAGRLVPGAPHQVLLVMDAVTGQNGLEQARQFSKIVGVTGLVLAKLDGTAKGGIAVAIARELGVPIRWIGVGERVEDLVPFDSAAFVRSLFPAREAA